MAKNPLELVNEMETPKPRIVKGSSPEYTEKVNKAYESSLPLLREKGYDVDNFNMDVIEGHLHKLFEDSDADEELQGLYKKSMYDAGNKIWDTKYKPTFDALMAALDKFYNDDWQSKAPMGYE